MANPTMLSELHNQAYAIYTTWLGQGLSTARAMLRQVPSSRIPYVVFTMSVLAIHEGRQYQFSKFIEGVTE